MPFFVSNKKRVPKKGGNKKRQTEVKKSRVFAKAEKRLQREEIESSSDEDIPAAKKFKEDDYEEDTETANEKGERLSTQYIKELKSQRESQDDAIEDTYLRKQLKNEVLEASGKLFHRVANNFKDETKHQISTFKCKKFQHKTVTCVAVNHQDGSIFSSSLDCSIVKYSRTGEILGVIKSSHQAKNNLYPAHRKEIFSIAVSSDGKYLVSGDAEGIMHVWSAETLEHIEKFHKHRKAVTGLAFQQNTYNLYSCSLDRLVMEWCLENMTYVDNLGGHSVGVQAIDSLNRQSCITCGGYDETVIIYAIEDDKQFQFSAKQTSIDGVKLINENTFITYGQDGSLCLWSTTRKRPLQQLRVAHGYKGESKEPHWITAVAALTNSDLIASGSTDGFIRLWRTDAAQARKLYSLCRIPIPCGVVNSLVFTDSGNTLVVGLARTHKLGRWFVHKSPNCVLRIALNGGIPSPVVEAVVKSNGVLNGTDEDGKIPVPMNGVGSSDSEEGNNVGVLDSDIIEQEPDDNLMTQDYEDSDVEEEQDESMMPLEDDDDCEDDSMVAQAEEVEQDESLIIRDNNDSDVEDQSMMSEGDAEEEDDTTTTEEEQESLITRVNNNSDVEHDVSSELELVDEEEDYVQDQSVISEGDAEEDDDSTTEEEQEIIIKESLITRDNNDSDVEHDVSSELELVDEEDDYVQDQSMMSEGDAEEDDTTTTEEEQESLISRDNNDSDVSSELELVDEEDDYVQDQSVMSEGDAEEDDDTTTEEEQEIIINKSGMLNKKHR